MLPVDPRPLGEGVKVFLVFTVDHEEEWGDYVKDGARLLRTPSPDVKVVVIDNDCPPELGVMIHSIAETMNSKVQRIERTPRWRIISDILTGQAVSGSTEPVLIADASDPRLAQPIEIIGLLGPAGAISDRFVFTENPAEMMECLGAKTMNWPEGNPFAPGTVVTRLGVRHAAPLENLATLFGVDATDEAEAAQETAEMPPPVHESLIAYYRERMGDDAAWFLTKLQTASQIADDFVDGEMKPQWASGAMRNMIELLLLDIPHDPFYGAHEAILREAVAQCVSVWDLSNELSSDPTPESRAWCYVQREAFQMVIWRVAVIVGGLDLGRRVLREIQQMLHGPNGAAKRYPDWLAETRAKSTGR